MADPGSVDHPTDLDAAVLTRRVPFGRSLRLRLSLLTTALIALVILILFAAVNRELVRMTRRSGGERALAASAQIAGMMTQIGARGINEVRRLADDPELLAYLESPTPQVAAALQARLQWLSQAGQPPATLLDYNGRVALEIAGSDSRRFADGLTQPSGVPAHTGIGPLQLSHGTFYADVVISVGPGNRDDEGLRAKSGFLVLRRVIQRAQNNEAWNRLVAAGGTVAVGNRTGPPWSDFSHEVPVPPIDTTHSGPSDYTAPNGERRVGGVSLIDGTPWALWVDFPETMIMAPARAFLRRLVLFAVLAMVFAAGAVAMLSAYVTKPLGQLTSASEAITAGNYSAHVTTDRKDEVGRLAQAFNTMVDRVAEGRRELEDRVQQRTARLAETTGLLEKRVGELQHTRTELETRASELAVVNQELEAFSYSVSHDLRAPLRHITGFAALLDGSAHEKLTGDERRHLTTIVSSAGRMGRLIDDLLAFSRTGRKPIEKQRVSLSEIVTAVRQEQTTEAHADRVEWSIGALPDVEGDPSLLELVVTNLIGNALKYTRHQPSPHIEIGMRDGGPREVVIYVKDNGAGFDMRYVDRLFGVFQRLHTDEEFEGTGIGLAGVRRIIYRHGGRAWAEGAVNQGATFYFSLPR